MIGPEAAPAIAPKVAVGLASGPALADARPRAAGRFRSDINGLRAIAIVAVVAFHLARPVAPGGFAGVDVFFVISGYLMTEIVERRLAEGRFRLGEFYLARLRRIWPALLTLCLALWLVGALVLDPWTFEDMARDLPAAMSFLSNFVFAHRVGYFAPDESANWLLHTWSLAVEWQFYLVYPLLLMGLYARPGLKRRLWPILAGLLALSFALSLALAPTSPKSDFYLLPTRAWELLAGAGCAWAERRFEPPAWARGALHVAGLALIAIGVWVARPGEGWPSATTLLPVAGTALVIAAGLRRTYWAENPVADGLGRASYSIYIWHWPLLVGLRYAGVPLDGGSALAALAGMLALGFGSYWLIERRATAWLFGQGFARPRLAVALAAGLVLASVAAASSHGLEALRTLGAPAPVRAALADDRAAAGDWAFPAACSHLVRQGDLQICFIGDPTARASLVIGDSHAQQLAPRYAHSFDGRRGEGVAFVTKGGCIPIPGVGLAPRGGACARWADDAWRYAASAGFRRVAVVSAWPAYFRASAEAPTGVTCLVENGRCLPTSLSREGLARAEFARLAAAATGLRDKGAEVALVDPAPASARADPHRLYRLAFAAHDIAPAPIPRAEAERDAEPMRADLAFAAGTSHAALIDPLDGLCPRGLCPIVEAGRTLYKDGDHFRASAVTGPDFAYLDAWLGAH